MSERPAVPQRREPPPFRRCRVVGAHGRSATMVRVVLGGSELVGLERGEPGSSVRLLLPRDDGVLELPDWNGNEFRWSDGTRARIRTLTPLQVRADAGAGAAGAELDVDIVLHGTSPLTRWAQAALDGEPVEAAISGTASGYEIDARATSYVLLGDESAVPAITTLLAELSPSARLVVVVERRPDAEPVELPAHSGATVTWSVLPDGAAPGSTLADALDGMELEPGTRVWAAGEAAGVQRLRKVLFDGRGVPRSHASIRGYWKAGRDGT
ncbi:MAG: siderophore-interacting protein [Microthrixaceae bacterium]